MPELVAAEDDEDAEMDEEDREGYDWEELAL